VYVGVWHQVYEYSSRDSTAGFQVLQGQQYVLVKEPKRIYREGRIEPILLDGTLCPRNGIECRGGQSLVCLHVEKSKTSCSQIHLTEYNFDGQLLAHRSADSPRLDGQCLWRGSDDDVLAQTIVGFDQNAQPVVAIATTRPPEAYYSLLQIEGGQPVELATLAKRMYAGIDVHVALERLKLAAPRCSTDGH
jgi:hypothetical protein